MTTTLSTPKTLPKTLLGYPVLAFGPARRGGGQIALVFRTDYTFQQFVTWSVWEGEGHFDCSHGHYIETLAEAWEDFNERSFGEVR